LTQVAWKHDVQVMIEGPGHVPMHKIKENMDKQLTPVPRGAVLQRGAAGDRRGAGLRPHHVGDRRGHDRLVRNRDVVLRDAQGAPGAAQSQDVKDGVIAYKIAAHAADLAKGHPGRRSATTRCRKARFEFRWQDQFNLSLDPDTGARVPRRDVAGAGRQGRAFLFDVRARTSAR
jgi:phosphomethylpyrimidine synthase